MEAGVAVRLFEDDIPNVGDYVTYEIAEISVIVTRSAPNQVSAFYNTCLHRGAALVEEPGNTREFMCPYHGWRYGLDGTLNRLPAGWDFPNTCPGKDKLPQIKADTAFGLVFINLDQSDLHSAITCRHFPSTSLSTRR